MFDADAIGDEWRIQRAFGAAVGTPPICACGNALVGSLPKHEGEAVEFERKNEERVSYPATCGNCNRVKRYAFKPDYPRPRWRDFRVHPSMRGTLHDTYMRRVFRSKAAQWVDVMRERRGE